jgi:hypothetical protein
VFMFVYHLKISIIVTLNVDECLMRMCDMLVCMFVRFAHLFWCPIYTFVTECESLHAKIQVNNVASYATNLYHNASLLIEYLEGHS